MKGVTKGYFLGTLIGHMAGFGRAGQLRAGYVTAGAVMAGQTVARVGGMYHPLNLLPKPAEMQATNQERGYRGPIARRYGSYHDKKNVGGPPMRMALYESRGGEHTSRSGTPKTRKSMRGPSAKRKAYLVGTEGTRFAGKAISGHKLGTRGPCDKGYVFKKVGRKYMCVPR